VRSCCRGRVWRAVCFCRDRHLREGGAAARLCPAPPSLQQDPSVRAHSRGAGGLQLFETDAIAHYLVAAFPNGKELLSADPAARARCIQIMRVMDNYAFKALVWGVFVEECEHDRPRQLLTCTHSRYSQAPKSILNPRISGVPCENRLYSRSKLAKLERPPTGVYCTMQWVHVAARRDRASTRGAGHAGPVSARRIRHTGGGGGGSRRRRRCRWGKRRKVILCRGRALAGRSVGGADARLPACGWRRPANGCCAMSSRGWKRGTPASQSCHQYGRRGFPSR
jgi:hypothetical protein